MSIALIDIQTYHNSCSLVSGLVEITRALDNRKPSRDELERDIVVLKEEIRNISVNLNGVNIATQQEILNKYAEQLKQKVLLLTDSSD